MGENHNKQGILVPCHELTVSSEKPIVIIVAFGRPAYLWEKRMIIFSDIVLQR